MSDICVTTLVDVPHFLGEMIARAAELSDSPEKWAKTLVIIRRNGVDPAGYEDFENGRLAIISAVWGGCLDGASNG